MKIYLAGPDVFLHDAVEIGRRKVEMCRRHGLIGLYPLDNAIDPAAAILEFAEGNHVDHIVIGARQNSLVRTLLGSVSAKVAAEAPCTVTVVRPPR